MYHKRSTHVKGFAAAAIGRVRGVGARAPSCGEQTLSVNNVLMSGLSLGFYMLVDVKD